MTSTENLSTLEQELKSLIIESLCLEDVTPQDIESDAPLFGEGLGLDSIDALELGIAIKQRYSVTMKNDSPENKAHFSTVTSLAQFIRSQSAESPT